jgi:hypothetical protein
MFDDAQLHMSPVHKQMEMTVVEHRPGFVVLSMPLRDEIRGLFEGTIPTTAWNGRGRLTSGARPLFRS